jgi:LuxR family transcriptional regulator, maltose regulon positive regulatory protein
MSEGNGSGGGRTRGPRFPSSKFSVPRAPSRLVHRPRLFGHLDRGQERRLTLVVGSPGAGKTVLLADWLAVRPQGSSAWLTCDGADADPVRFFAGIIESCRRATGNPRIGEDAYELLTLDGEISADAVAALCDDLETKTGPLVLVLDDVHLVGDSAAEALTLLLEYRPPTLQLVLATRVDPQLRLHRMRAAEEIAEVRDRELTFSTEETAEFLTGFDVRLSVGDLGVVHQRSEGWAAGLQMAAISIHDSADPADAARRIELRGRTVAGYFLDEVLYRQPANVVDFMLATSVLDELSHGACTALCGPPGPALLEHAYTANLFVVNVDETARTFRYHHLIGEVLRSELHARDPSRERLLNMAAAEYLADVGEIGRAARHLLAAGEPTRAFTLLAERVIADFSVNRRLGSALDVDEAEPELFAGNVEILATLAAELLLRGSFDRGARALALAERTPLDPAGQPDAALRLTFVNALHSCFIGQLDEALEYSRRAPRPAVKAGERNEWVDALDAIDVLCHAYMGDFMATSQLADALAVLEPREPPREMLYPGAKSLAALYEGELGAAEALARAAQVAVSRLGFRRHYFSYHSERALALLALERRDLSTAAALTERALDIFVAGRPLFDFLAQVDRAKIWTADGNFEDALASLPAARSALRSDHSFLFGEADELEARLRLALGDREGAEAVATRIPGLRGAIVSAVVALASGKPDEAAETLDKAVAAGARMTVRSELELRLLRASVAALQGSPDCDRLVKDALSLAEQRGFVQTVLDTAPQIVLRLLSHAERYPRTDYYARLISGTLATRKSNPALAKNAPLPDPLTAAELRILQKLPLRLSYSELATDLHLSLNTVKTHLQHTYMKLGVTSRSDAVKRAAVLGLV